ncbi:MAG: hypothetical protein ACP5E4_01715 [Candidatus Aenigmatarchaeota archaeon]
MGYIIGVSSGMFGMAQPQEKIGLIDLSQKGFYSALKGVNFTQIDLETSAEFIAPEIHSKLQKLREEMKINYGIHGLSAAMGAKGIFLDSAIKDDWERTQDALVRDIRRSAEAGAKYYLQHASETNPYGWLGKDFQSTDIVDIWGRPLYVFLEDPENRDVYEWLITQDEVRSVGGATVDEIKKGISYDLRREAEAMVDRQMQIEGKFLTRESYERDQAKFMALSKERDDRIEKYFNENLEPKAIKQAKDAIKRSIMRPTLHYGPERLAYIATAKWMSLRGDPLWKGIVGNKSIDSIKYDYNKWVPAVSLKYIYGHFFPEDAKREDGYRPQDPKPYMKEHNLFFVIETETLKAGVEDMPRVANPAHFVVLCREMESRGLGLFKAAIDFEHCLGAGLWPVAEKGHTGKGFIEEMLPNGGKYVNVLHVGWPTAIGPAHVPIYLGSDQQEWLYQWLYLLKKKGFDESEDRFIIFERAGGVGGDPVDQSTMALKKIVDFLRMDVKPEDLSKPENLHFYGVEDASLKMQEVQIREHAMDPIRGLLQVPEEQHGFIGGTAVQKGKGKEWEAGKMR